MRIRLLALLVLVAAPAAQACSLVYVPYDQAVWADDLQYIDQGALKRVENRMEQTVATGYFLSFAPLADGVLLARQQGLGADCSGSAWLELRRNGETVWSKPGESRVWEHPLGPFVQHERKLYRLDGDELAPLPVGVPKDTWVLGWTHAGLPVHRDGDDLVVGDVRVPDEGGHPLVASSPSSTALLFHEDTKVRLRIVTGGQVSTTTWSPGRDFSDLAWAGAWYAVAGGRAFHVPTAGGGVTDLGVEAVAVGAKGDQAVILGEERYTIVDGTVAVDAARRLEDVWIPEPARASPKPVTSQQDTGSAQPHTPAGPGDEQAAALAPGAMALALAAVAAAAARATRRRP